MRNTDKLSVVDKLLIAALNLEREGKASFSAEDFVVAAWKAFPHTFGLSGHADNNGSPLYPDSNRVFAEIMGSKPVREKGFLVKTGEKLYALTDTGRARAVSIREQGDASVGHSSSERTSIGREIRERLKVILSSRAVQKYSTGEQDRITFHDACLFWGITPRSSAIELMGRLENMKSAIVIARGTIDAGASAMVHGGGSVTQHMLDLVEATHCFLVEKFSDEIRTIERRTDQRRN